MLCSRLLDCLLVQRSAPSPNEGTPFRVYHMLALVWSCWWWKEWDNSHDNQGEIFIFDDGYETVYQCVCEVSAWLAIHGVIVNVEKKMSVIVRTWNLNRCFCNFESILREITKGFSVYNGSLGVIKNGKLKRCFCKWWMMPCCCIWWFHQKTFFTPINSVSTCIKVVHEQWSLFLELVFSCKSSTNMKQPLVMMSTFAYHICWCFTVSLAYTTVNSNVVIRHPHL